MAQSDKESSSIHDQFGHDESLKEVLELGTDLREYSQEIEKELQKVSQKSISAYIDQSSNIANLHFQIGSCDKILENMESMLTNFQQVLNNISSEITILQKKSCNMSAQLTNRYGKYILLILDPILYNILLFADVLLRISCINLLRI